MRTLSLVLAALCALCALPLRAQVVAFGPPPPGKAAPKEPSCPCDVFGYKALTPKGTALSEYWEARRKAKASRTVSSLFFLFGAMARSGAAVNEAQAGYGKAMDELYAARSKAEAAGAVKVTGEDLKEDSIEFLVKKGVDYQVER